MKDRFECPWRECEYVELHTCSIYANMQIYGWGEYVCILFAMNNWNVDSYAFVFTYPVGDTPMRDSLVETGQMCQQNYLTLLINSTNFLIMQEPKQNHLFIINNIWIF